MGLGNQCLDLPFLTNASVISLATCMENARCSLHADNIARGTVYSDFNEGMHHFVECADVAIKHCEWNHMK